MLNTTSSRNWAEILGAILGSIVAWIIICTIYAIPLKYIFLDYFARIGWATDFSFLTTVMILFTAKFSTFFLRSGTAYNVQRSDNQ